jgi:hypothetical protein
MRPCWSCTPRPTRPSSRLDDEGRPPEGALLNDCASDGAPFGLLAAGSRLRLFEASPALGSAAARYLDLDTAALQADDRPFLALLAPAMLAQGGFDSLVEEARAFGTALRKRIDERIRQGVLPTLGHALGRWARVQGRDPADDAVREELERAALTLVFRLLFLAYAESARYLPVDQASYRKVSLAALVDEAAETAGALDPARTPPTATSTGAGRCIGSPPAVVIVICGSIGPSSEQKPMTISSAARAMRVRALWRCQEPRRGTARRSCATTGSADAAARIRSYCRRRSR